MTLQDETAVFGRRGRILTPPAIDDLIQGCRSAELLAKQREIWMKGAEVFRGESPVETPVVVAIPGSVLLLGSQNRWADQKPRGEAGRPLISETLRKEGVRLDHQQPRAKRNGFLQEPRMLETNPYGPAALAKHPVKGCSTGGKVAFAHRCCCINGHVSSRGSWDKGLGMRPCFCNTRNDLRCTLMRNQAITSLDLNLLTFPEASLLPSPERLLDSTSSCAASRETTIAVILVPSCLTSIQNPSPRTLRFRFALCACSTANDFYT